MKIACYTEPIEKGFLLHYPSLAVKTELLQMWERSKEKYNCYMTVELKMPYRARTTGKGSQNNLYWALVQVIANETGEETQSIHEELKFKAISKGFPYHISKISGKPVPESTTKVNTVEMSYLIDTAYEVIAFLGIVLDPELQKGSETKAEDDNLYSDCEQGEYDIF